MNKTASNTPTKVYGENVEHYFLFGIPCSGKGEHGKIIQKECPVKLQKIEMGELFRNEIKLGTRLGKIIEKDVWAGNLLNDEYAFEMLNRFDLGLDTLFDGALRTPSQERDYSYTLYDMHSDGYTIHPAIISIDTKIDTAIARMTIRLEKTKAKGLPVRKDDELEILRHRINLAETVTAEALYNAKHRNIPTLHVDGETDILGTPEAYQYRVNEINTFIKGLRQKHRV